MMLPLTGNSNGTLECGCQDVPFPGPTALVLLSAPAGPAEAAMLVEGAIVFDSWAVVISKSVLLTTQSVARKVLG